MSRSMTIFAVALLLALPAKAQITDPDLNDIPAKIVPEQSRYDYEKRVVEIPITLAEKRPPSIALFRRVPNVLRQVGKLVWVLRVAAPPQRERSGAASDGVPPERASGS